MAIPNLFKKKAGAAPEAVKLSTGEKPAPLIPKEQMHPVGSHVSSHAGGGLDITLSELLAATGLAATGIESLITSISMLPVEESKEDEPGAHEDDADDPEAQAAELDASEIYQGPGSFAHPDPAIDQYVKTYAGKLSPEMIVQKVKLKFGLSESMAYEEVHFALAEHQQEQILSAIEQAKVEQVMTAPPPSITMAVQDIDPDALLELLGQQMKKQMNKDQS